MPRLRDQYFEIDDSASIEQLAEEGTELCKLQRSINWWLGDLARFSAQRYPESWQQFFPEWASPGLLTRCKAVSEAYPREEDRNILATWSQHMQVANKPDRIALVAAMVDSGQTTDESRAAPPTTPTPEPDKSPQWLLAVDVHYFLHRFWFSGAGVEAAHSLAQWLTRTVDRLRDKGVTDVACCFDSPVSNRKIMVATAGWDDQYKDRPPKDPELSHQLHLLRDLCEQAGFCCASVSGWEADDVMSSYASQFPGFVTLVTQDKDCRQCLSKNVNMLLDVEWIEDQSSGELVPTYRWVSAKQHFEQTGILPAQWVDYQAIMGDAADTIKGAAGIGAKGAADIIKQFGSIEAAILAAKAEHESLKPRTRAALIAFEPKAALTRELTRLRTDLPVPANTRIP